MLTCAYLWDVRDALHAGLIGEPAEYIIFWFNTNCWGIG